MDSDTSQTSADGSHACCDELIELVAKLRTELHKKDEELEQKKQELAWKHANFSKMAMDSSTQTSADHHTCICSKIFELAENLRIELDKKDEELAKEKQEKQVYKLFCWFHVYTVQ
jgi:malate synthase